MWIFALLAFFSPLGVSLGGGLMLLALVLRRRDWGALARPSVVLSLVFAVYVLVRGWAAMQAYPMHHDIAKYTQGWAWLALWFVPAFWMGRAVNSDRVVLVLALTGLLVGSVMSVHEHGTTILTAGRDDFRIRPISLSLFCGFFLLAVWIHLPALWPRLRGATTWLRMIVGAAALLCSAVLVQIIIRGQSRGAWLAMLVAAFLLAIWTWRRYASSVRASVRSGVIVALVALGAILVMANAEFILYKLNLEKHAASVVLSQGLEAAPVTSMTHRLAMWEYVLKTLPHHPVFGIGPAVGEYLTADSPNPKLHNPEHDNEPFEHFHNLFFQAAMDLGLVGLVLLVAIVGFALGDAVRNVRAGRGDPARLAFVVIALVMTGIWSLFDFRAVYWDWRGFWFLLMSTVFYVSVPREAGEP